MTESEMGSLAIVLAGLMLLAVVIVVALVWSHSSRQVREVREATAEIDRQIALSGYVLGDCPHGGHQGRDCPNWKKGKA